LFAGSGGATDTINESDLTTALTGTFSFSESGSVEVLETDNASNGSASASGSISVFDSVVQSGPGSLSVLATRTASGTAMHGSGTGVAQSYQNQVMQVRFVVNDTDARYTLAGSFDPGAITTLIGEAHNVRLYRPFTSNVLENFDEAATMNESGLLIAGRTYEFRIHLNDRNRGTASDPSNSDASSFNLQFNVTSIPEPGSLMLLLIGLCIVSIRRPHESA